VAISELLVYFEEFRNKTGNDYVYPETSYIFDMKPAIREETYLIIDMLTSNTVCTIFHDSLRVAGY